MVLPTYLSHKHIESFVIFLCFVVFGGASAGLGAAFPQLEEDLDHSDTLKFSVLGRGLGFLCGLLVCLFVISKWNSSWFVWVMVVLTVFSSCFTLALAFIADIPYYEIWLVVFPFFQGLGFASCDAVGNHFLLEKWRDMDGGNATGQSWVHIVHAGFTGGGLIGPLLVGAMGYRNGFLVLGFLAAIPLTLLSVSSMLNGSMISKSTPSTSCPPVVDFQGKTLNPVIVYALEIWFFFLMGQEIAFSSWISSYVVDSGVSDSDAKAAYASSAFYAAMLFGRIMMGLSSTIKSMKNAVLLKAFVWFQMVTSTLLLLFAFTKKEYDGDSYYILVALIVMFGISVNSLIGMGINMIEDHACLKWESNLIVKEIIGLSVGEVVLPVLVGVIFHGTQPYTLMLSLFIMALVILIVYALIEHLIHTNPSVEGPTSTSANEPLMPTKSKDRISSLDNSYYR
jgi:MFS family permease